MRRAGALGAAALLASCAGAPQGVTSETQAIAIAKDRCAWTRPFEAGEHWRAKLHDGRWHVWLQRDRDVKEPVVGQLDIWIGARDGAAGDCNRVS
ncbi:MAG TPA: hypothetical protein VG889_16885 [Rhizomicrobium sp.]|nr:hypothetical protein [Rhizomicrobium sp.]